MQTYQGVIKSWKQDRGFGFIESAAAEKDIFIHIRDIKHSGYEPKIGDNVSYKLMVDKQGKVKAYDAYIDGQPIIRPAIGKTKVAPKKINRPDNRLLGIIFLFIALIPFVFSGFIIKEQHNILPFSAYLLMSLLTFFAYAIDKTKAHKGLWRIQESTLHVFELLGGWPGALLTQKLIRHKNKKTSYQIKFWLIVLAHLMFWFDFRFFGGQSFHGLASLIK